MRYDFIKIECLLSPHFKSSQYQKQNENTLNYYFNVDGNDDVLYLKNLDRKFEFLFSIFDRLPFSVIYYFCHSQKPKQNKKKQLKKSHP